MIKGFNKIFWGFIIVLFNINIGPINLMPDFAGYFIMSSGLAEIINIFESKSFSTARTIISFLFIYSLFSSILRLLGIYDLYTNNDYKSIIDLSLTMFIMVIRLIATFNILSGAIELYLSKEQQLKAQLLIESQRLYTILSLIGLFSIAVSLNISDELFSVAAAVFVISVEIYFIVLLKRIRNDFSNDDLMEV